MRTWRSYPGRGFVLWMAIVVGPTICLAAPPKLTSLFPAGGQRSQTVAASAAGEFPNWPVQSWVDRPGVQITCGEKKGELSLAIAADAVPGTYWLRLFDAEGATSLRPFIVGTLPEVAEAETNDLPEAPQVVPSQVVVNGRLAKNGDLDGYRVDLKAGETLVAALVAHSVLGSPMDAVLQVSEIVERPGVTPQKPRVEAYVVAQNHDAVGLDPLLTFTPSSDGAYLVRVFAFPSEPNSTIGFAGGDTYVYRLTLTTGSFIHHTLPLAIGPATTQAQLGGWNLPAASRTVDLANLQSPPHPLAPPDAPRWIFHPEAAGAMSLPRVNGQAAIVPESTTADNPLTVELPAVLGGELASADEVDSFSFVGQKDQAVRVAVQSASLGLGVDPFVQLLAADGKLVGESDDEGRDERDPVLSAKLPADGTYRVLVLDLHFRGGPRMAYRITIEEPTDDYELKLTADSFVFDGTKPLEIPLSLVPRDGFSEPVEVHVLGLPPGVTAEPLTIEPKATGEANAESGRVRRGGRGRNNQPAAGATEAKLILKLDPAVAPAGGVPIRIEARTKGENPLIRTAQFPLGQPLAGSHWAAWLTVGQAKDPPKSEEKPAE
jgi:hypothetical protein